jgi:hypothetical protein
MADVLAVSIRASRKPVNLIPPWVIATRNVAAAPTPAASVGVKMPR